MNPPFAFLFSLLAVGLEGQAKRQTYRTTSVEALLREAPVEPTEIRVVLYVIDRVNRQKSPCNRINPEGDGADSGEVISQINRREEWVIEEVVKERADAQLRRLR